MHVHGWHVWRRASRHVVRSMLQMEGKLVLVGEVRQHMGRIRGRQCAWRACKRIALKVLLVGKEHGRVGLFVVVLALPPGGRSVVGRAQTGVVFPVSTLRGLDRLDAAQDITLLAIDTLGLASDDLANWRGRVRDRGSGARGGAWVAGGAEAWSKGVRPKFLRVGV